MKFIISVFALVVTVVNGASLNNPDVSEVVRRELRGGRGGRGGRGNGRPQVSEECKGLVEELCPSTGDKEADRECRKQAFDSGLIPDDCKPQRGNGRPQVSEECKALVEELCPSTGDKEADRECRKQAFDSGLIPDDCKPQRGNGRGRPKLSEECKVLISEICPKSGDKQADLQCRKQAYDDGVIPEDCRPRRGRKSFSEECKTFLDEICPITGDRQVDRQCRKETIENGLLPDECTNSTSSTIDPRIRN